MELKGAIRAELCRLVRDNQMINAVKYLVDNGASLHLAKELVTRAHEEIDPKAARKREKWLDVVEHELGGKKLKSVFSRQDKSLAT